jgi:16S rRNA (cytidine1402-2'-O)-methyltransferase
VAGGVLYVVATPIGNLADTTARAVEVLGRVDRIAAEDTRRTRRLLSAHGIGARLESYHDHNEDRMAPRLVRGLVAGESVALVTDAGTPGISDPAYRLIQQAIASGVRVESIPGASAVLTALVVSGLPMDRFVFEGFPPRRPGQLRRRLAALAELPHTLVFFENPARLKKFLDAVHEVLGDRPLAVCRELTKLHEQVWRGSVDEWLAASAPTELRGEITVVLGGLARTTRRRRARSSADPAAGNG